MFKKIKDKAVKKMMERQLRNAPPEQRKVIMTLMEKNPELMEKIAKEIKAETKNGASEMAAAMKVMPKYQGEIQATLGVSPQHGGGARFNPNGTIHR